MDYFAKFSPAARQILISAQKISQNNNSALGTQHILLALISNPGTLAHELLKDMNVALDPVRLLMSLQQEEQDKSGMTDFAKLILERATQASAHFKHVNVDAEHLLLSIVTEENCAAFKILQRIGANPDHIEKQIIDLFEELQDLDQLIHKVNPNIIFHGGPINLKDNHDQFSRRDPKSPPQKLKSKTPALDYFGTDLTKLAKQQKLDPIIGRDDELQRIMQILVRKTKNNPILVGEPGVGKTAIIEGLAQKISSKQVPSNLGDKRLISLDLALIVAGTTYRGQFEERIKKILDEIKHDPNILIFIDELHTIVGAGSAEGTLDASNMIKPSLSRGEMRLIGSTTTKEFRKYIDKDAALSRRLQQVKVEEPSEIEAIEILKGIKLSYEKHHSITISDEAIESSVKLAKRYITDRYLPDSAIDLIDESSARLSLSRPTSTAQKSRSKAKLAQIITDKNAALRSGDFSKASKLREQEYILMNEINQLKKINPIQKNILSASDISTTVSLITGIPVGELVTLEKKRLLNLENVLSSIVIGQDEATKAIATTIKRSKAGISNYNRPLGSFLFLGPTGVGKTFLAQTLANQIFGSPKNLIKIDMSEFGERHSVSGLVGAPPGYVGYGDAGRLTELVKNQPYSVVLLDEIEKAHPDIFNILLQILEDGYITDSQGTKVNFKNTIIILTSNIGAQTLQSESIGFGSKASNKFENIKEKLKTDLKNYFKPELINRLDQIIIFNQLSKNSLKQIVKSELIELSNRLRQNKINIAWDDNVLNKLIDLGFDQNYGARQLRRIIIKYIEDPLADLILKSNSSISGLYNIKIKKDTLTLEIDRHDKKLLIGS